MGKSKVLQVVNVRENTILITVTERKKKLRIKIKKEYKIYRIGMARKKQYRESMYVAGKNDRQA